ncbi:MAG: hypothetical protein J6N54_10025 [Bacteroidales bacterium]|nr:hypothetical protein [Bacteroidales bacterium]
MMKNAFLSVAFMLLSISAVAQTTEGNLFSGPEDFDTYPREVYCEIESYTKRILTNKVAVKVDFGQETNFSGKDNRLVDENGEDIIFNSIIDAANYMSKRGWIFKQAYVIQDIDSGAVSTHWIMAKKVTCPEQILEGLRTFRMAIEE